MELFDLLLTVTRQLERQHIVHALTGSLASSYYGKPKASQDADIGLRMTRQQAKVFASAFDESIYVSEEGLLHAIEHEGMANMIHGASGWVIDLSILPASAFFNEVLSRRRRIELADDAETAIWISTPEDVILMKLLWRRESRSAKQFEDALNAAIGQRAQLDWSYLRRWAVELGIGDDLEELRKACDV